MGAKGHGHSVLTTALQRHQHDLSLLLGHEDANSSVAVGTSHISLVFDVLDTFLGQIVRDELEASSPLRYNKDLTREISV